MEVTRYKICQLYEVRLDRISYHITRNSKQVSLDLLRHKLHNSIFTCILLTSLFYIHSTNLAKYSNFFKFFSPIFSSLSFAVIVVEIENQKKF